MAELIVKSGINKGKKYSLSRESMTIGRASDNDIVFFNEVAVSRKHARFVKEGDSFYVVDLGSKNGTRLNGEPVHKEKLKEGDEILVGKSVLVFHSTSSEEAVFLSREGPVVDDSGTIYRPLKEVIDEDVLAEPAVVKPKPWQKAESAEKQVPDIRRLEKNNQILKIMNQVGRALTQIKPLDEFLDLVLEQVFRIIPAERGFLMLYDEKKNEFIPKVVRYGANIKESDKKITLSRTIAERAVKDKVAILTSDALADPRFNGGESIQLYGIRSAMCVPLSYQEKIFGIIHVDSLMSSNCFTTDDLNLFTALASQAAVGLEQARLYEKIQEESKIRANLERYHSPEVINMIINKKDVRQAQERQATILYSDVVGFTSLSEKLPPQEIAALLNEYFTIMTDVIFHHQGTLDKFIGDALMALFGVPISHGDDVDRSIMSALDMRKELHQFNLRKPKEEQLNIRIGINTGKVIAGDLGSDKRLEYTVLGDAVNTASRLESTIAQPGQIVVGETTYQLADKKLFDFLKLGEYQIRGREKRIGVYEVLGRR
ncbi:FHA domain-containing protein [bacterium]|nr:FHA domain-containing protein [bacterium]